MARVITLDTTFHISAFHILEFDARRQEGDGGEAQAIATSGRRRGGPRLDRRQRRLPVGNYKRRSRVRDGVHGCRVGSRCGDCRTVAGAVDHVASREADRRQRRVPAYLSRRSQVQEPMCFINCLTASKDEDNSVEIVYSDGEDRDLELHLGIKVRVVVSEWKLKYTFLLKNIELEPVDRVFATLRDQEEKLNEQDAKIAALEDLVRELTQQPSQASQVPQTPRRQESRAPVFVRVQGTKKVGMDHVIPWKVSSCEPSAESRDQGLRVAAHHILVEKPGVFAVHVHVLHNSPADGVVFEVLVNGTAVATCVDAEASLSSLSHVVRVARNDTLSVEYRGQGSAYKDSYLVAYELR